MRGGGDGGIRRKISNYIIFIPVKIKFPYILSAYNSLLNNAPTTLIKIHNVK